MAIGQPLSFGALLRRYRLAAGLTQEALAERARLSVRGISDLERGVNRAARPITVALLAEALSLGTEERAALQACASPPAGTVVSSAGPSIEPTAAIATNLPLALTSFVGRARDVATVRHLLGETRLLTLTGAGGCGKTRLALEVAHALAQDAHQAAAFRDGIWLVELAALGDGALVPPAVATVLGIRERPSQALLDSLTAVLRPRRVLLLLDNCEHLLVDCAHLAEALLRACPHLTILATSRESLGIGGERLWRVPSLSLPDPWGQRTPERALAYEAVQLFVQRAQAVRPEWRLSEPQVRLTEQVCRQLDGIPLAIELAAARLATLSLDQLSQRLDDRFRVLTGGSRTALPRQRTLRATLDWSYDLLDEQERRFLCRLSVFAGGWTLEAAEAVCSGRGIAAEEILDLLSGLVAKSLAVLEEGAAGARYGLLETVRQYAREKLIAAGEEVALRDSHLTWSLTLGEQIAQRMGGAEREVRLDQLELELENLRTALAWSSRQDGRSEAGLRLAASMEDFWYLRGYASEGRRWLDDLLARGVAAAGLRARALDVLALLAHYQGDEAPALAHFVAAYALHQAEGDAHSAAWSLTHQALVMIYQGDGQRAQPLLERALPSHREHGDRHGIGWALNYLAQIRQLHGDHAEAAALYKESLAVFQDLGDMFSIGDLLAHLANVARELGNALAAGRLLREGLRMARTLRDKPGIAKCLEGLAILAADDGQPAWAARLLGAAYGVREAIGTPVEVVDRSAHERAIAAVRAVLGEDNFTATWAAGQQMSLDEALAPVLDAQLGNDRCDGEPGAGAIAATPSGSDALA